MVHVNLVVLFLRAGVAVWVCFNKRGEAVSLLPLAGLGGLVLWAWSAVGFLGAGWEVDMKCFVVVI